MSPPPLNNDTTRSITILQQEPLTELGNLRWLNPNVAARVQNQQPTSTNAARALFRITSIAASSPHNPSNSATTRQSSAFSPLEREALIRIQHASQLQESATQLHLQRPPERRSSLATSGNAPSNVRPAFRSKSECNWFVRTTLLETAIVEYEMLHACSGYHVTQPCSSCLTACNNGHFWMFLLSIGLCLPEL
ncbi:hypothetical protein SmJEL517_g04231 [Synchytrium microbalum]|uniref:Uncharacterized protein n=1 Tax=Synchytrium microbalum TaxID=1806994 RepID=A0A507C5B5_9FUNG|nr:uncharacterized protein SmJEL517_g04231 [Synchytrium microbalum]TPX32733.1 hypothetical protein SmJEL517_g04231 [Synchytrium microbalum]